MFADVKLPFSAVRRYPVDAAVSENPRKFPFETGCALHAIKSSRHGLLKLITKFVNKGNLLSRGHCYVKVLQARDQALR